MWVLKREQKIIDFPQKQSDLGPSGKSSRSQDVKKTAAKTARTTTIQNQNWAMDGGGLKSANRSSAINKFLYARQFVTMHAQHSVLMTAKSKQLAKTNEQQHRHHHHRLGNTNNMNKHQY